ncbi:MAG: hypothetical protein H0T62_05210 [Parachlamydiaceae bacterium]|nr:hypothetical protein [Parachlamydiaceae bacterium]
MDPISTSPFSSEENQPLTCCKVLSGIVAAVSAVAAATFAISTYCIMTYGAPLAIVAFVVNPLATAGIAAAAALIFIIAISILSAKFKQVIIEKNENMGEPPSSKSENKPIGTEKSKVKKDKKPVTAETENELTQELNNSMPKSEALLHPPVKKINVSDVLQNFTEETSDNEKIEGLTKIPLIEIQEYIERHKVGYEVLIKQLFSIPPAILSQLDASKFTNDQVFWLCFGKDVMYMKSRHFEKITDGLADRQARFGALVGNNMDQLKRFNTPFTLPFFSASQLNRLKLSFDNEPKEKFLFFKKWSNVFPPYDNAKEPLLIGERDRFAKCFDAKDVQYMLEKGGFLEFPADLADDSLKEIECRNFRYQWKYALQLIPSEYVKNLDFSFVKTDNEQHLRINPFQLIYMLKDFTKSQVQALSTEQKNQIKETFELVREVLQKTNENSTRLKNFLTIPNNWNDYTLASRKIYTDEEFKIIFQR